MKKAIAALLVMCLIVGSLGTLAFRHYQSVAKQDYEDFFEDASNIKEEVPGTATADNESDAETETAKVSTKGKGKKAKSGVTSVDVIEASGERNNYVITDEMVDYYTSKQFNALVNDLADFIAKYPDHRIDWQMYRSFIEKRREATGMSDAVSMPLPAADDQKFNEIVHRIRTIPAYCDMFADFFARQLTENGEELGTQIPALRSFHAAHDKSVANGQRWQKLRARQIVMSPDDPMSEKLQKKMSKLEGRRGLEMWAEYASNDEDVQTNREFDEQCSYVINMLLSFDRTTTEIVDSSENYHLPPENVGSDMTTKACVNTVYQEEDQPAYIFLDKDKNGNVSFRFGVDTRDGRVLKVLEHQKYLAKRVTQTTKSTPKAQPKRRTTPQRQTETHEGSRTTGSEEGDITIGVIDDDDDDYEEYEEDEELIITGGGGGGGGSSTTIIVNRDPNKPNQPDKPKDEPNKPTDGQGVKDQSSSSAYQGNANRNSGTHIASDGDGEKTDKPAKPSETADTSDDTVYEGSENSGRRSVTDYDPGYATSSENNGGHATNGSTESSDSSNRESSGSTDSSGATVDNSISSSNDSVSEAPRESSTPTETTSDGGSFTMSGSMGD